MTSLPSLPNGMQNVSTYMNNGYYSVDQTQDSDGAFTSSSPATLNLTSNTPYLNLGYADTNSNGTNPQYNFSNNTFSVNAATGTDIMLGQNGQGFFNNVATISSPNAGVWLDGYNNNVTLNSGSFGVNSTGTGNTLNLTGTDTANTVSGNNDLPASESYINEGGSDDTINMTDAGGNLELTGSGSTAQFTTHNGGVLLGGQNNTLAFDNTAYTAADGPGSTLGLTSDATNDSLTVNLGANSNTTTDLTEVTVVPQITDDVMIAGETAPAPTYQYGSATSDNNINITGGDTSSSFNINGYDNAQVLSNGNLQFTDPTDGNVITVNNGVDVTFNLGNGTTMDTNAIISNINNGITSVAAPAQPSADSSLVQSDTETAVATPTVATSTTADSSLATFLQSFLGTLSSGTGQQGSIAQVLSSLITFLQQAVGGNSTVSQPIEQAPTQWGQQEYPIEQQPTQWGQQEYPIEQQPTQWGQQEYPIEQQPTQWGQQEYPIEQAPTQWGQQEYPIEQAPTQWGQQEYPIEQAPTQWGQQEYPIEQAPTQWGQQEYPIEQQPIQYQPITEGSQINQPYYEGNTELQPINTAYQSAQPYYEGNTELQPINTAYQSAQPYYEGNTELQPINTAYQTAQPYYEGNTELQGTNYESQAASGGQVATGGYEAYQQPVSNPYASEEQQLQASMNYATPVPVYATNTGTASQYAEL